MTVVADRKVPASYKEVSAKKLETTTEPLTVQIGGDALIAEPRPDLAGLRITRPVVGGVYLVGPEGFLHHVPNGDTYNNLFKNWDGIFETIDQIAKGEPLTVGAILARGSGRDAVFLVSNNVKRWITSPAVMDKYYFTYKNIVQVPAILIDFIPTGEPWR